MLRVLLVLLIALLSLRGFAGAGMQTGMGLMQLQAAAVVTLSVSGPASADVSPVEPALDSAACCDQCSVCDLCHLLLGQMPDRVAAPSLSVRALVAAADIRFSSVDPRSAHKPPHTRL